MKNLLLTPSIIILISTLLSAQLIENVQIPVSMFAATATTDPDPSLYQFEEIENTLQGVNIYLPPTEVATLYLQSGNHKIAFKTFRG